MACAVVGRAAARQKDPVEEEEGVDHGEAAAQHRQRRGQPREASPVVTEVPGGLEEHLFADEAVERGHPCQSQARQARRPRRQRHGAGQPSEPSHVPAARLVFDDARHEEERTLEDGVVERVEDGRGQCGRRRDAEEAHDEAELAHGRVGHQGLEVGLPQGQSSPPYQARQPDARHQPGPQLGATQHPDHPRDQVEPCLDHGGRVQEGADGRGGLHGVGKPDVEGHLRRLGKGPGQDQGGDERVAGTLADLGGLGAQTRQVEGARLDVEQHEAEQHGQPAAGRDEQRLLGAVAGALLVVPVADEQEGRDRGQLPEDVEDRQVAR